MNEVDLIPCPFCGGQVELHSTDGSITDYFISCKECGCRQSGSISRQAVIDAWNTRKPMDEGIEKLKEEMVFYEQIKKETEEKDYRYLYHKIAEAYGKAVVIMHKSKWQEKGE